MAELTNKELYRQEYKKLMRRVRYNEKTHGVVVLQSLLPKPNPKRVTKGMIEEVNQIRRSNLLMISEIPASNTTQTIPNLREIMPDTFYRVALDRFWKTVSNYPNSVSQNIMVNAVEMLIKRYGEEAVGEMLMNMTEKGILDACVYGSSNPDYGNKWVVEFMTYLPEETLSEQEKEDILEQAEGEEYDDGFVSAVGKPIPFTE